MATLLVAHGGVQTYRMRHDGRSLRGVARHHNSAHTEGLQFRNESDGIGTWWIAEGNQADDFECRMRVPQPLQALEKPLLFEFIGNGSRVGCRGPSGRLQS